MKSISRYNALLVIPCMILSGCLEHKQTEVISGRLNVVVDESIAPAIDSILYRFENLYPNAKITSTRASSREAVILLGQKKTRVAFLGREMLKDEEDAFLKTSTPVQKFKIATHAVALDVHPRNPVRTISLETIEKILSGEILSWNSLGWNNGKILVAIPGPNSSTFIAMQQLGLLKSLRCYFQFVESKVSMDSLIKAQPQTLAIIPLLWQSSDTTLSRSLDILNSLPEDSTKTLYPIGLHLANIYRVRYPLRSTIYAYSTGESIDLSTGVISFFISGAGQKQLLNNGVVPATAPVRLVQFGEHSGK